METPQNGCVASHLDPPLLAPSLGLDEAKRSAAAPTVATRSATRGREKAVVAEVDRLRDNDDAGSVRDSVAACCLGRRNAGTHAAPRSLVNRPPARWAGRPFAGISGYDRLPAGISGRFACGIHAGCKKGR